MLNSENIKRIDRIDVILKRLLYLLIFSMPISKGGINVISGLLFLILLLRIFLKRDYKFVSEGFDKLILSFLLIILLSAFSAGKDYGRSLHGFFSPVLQYAMVYYLIVNLISKEEEINKCIKIYWVGMSISACHAAYLKFVQGIFRVEGFTNNPNRLGSLMMIFIIINFSIVIFSKDKKSKLLSLVGLLFGGLGLIASLSRSALISTIIGTGIVTLLKNKRLIIVFLFCSILLVVMLPGHYKARLEELKDVNSSNVSQRWLLYEAGWALFKTFPITGIGFEATHEIYDKVDLEELKKLNQPYYHFHNLFINVAVELGIFGFINLLSLLFISIKKAFNLYKKRKNYFSVAIIGVIFAQVFQNTVDMNFQATQVGLVFVLLISLLVSKERMIKEGAY